MCATSQAVLEPTVWEVMHVWIDQDLCTGDGLCTDHCPEIFVILEDGIAYVDLELEWSLALPDGRVLELGSPELPELPCELGLSENADGSLHLDVALTGEGPLVELAEAVEVTGLSLQLEGIEIVPPAVE